MKGLEKIPQIDDLNSAYNELIATDALSGFYSASASGTGSTDNSDISFAAYKRLALYTQWARFDARLGEILVDFFSKHWMDLSPVRLSQASENLVWQGTFGVILEHVKLHPRCRSLDVNNSKRLLNWIKQCILMLQFKKTFEHFFIGQHSFASKRMLKDAQESLKVFLKYGFVGSDLLINKSEAVIRASNQSLLDVNARHEILSKLIANEIRFKLDDYVLACDHLVGRRQALRDLHSYVKEHGYVLKKLGTTKGCMYFVLKS